MPKPKTYIINGVSKTIRQLADESGMRPDVLRYRLEAGWPIDRVFDATAPIVGRPTEAQATTAQQARFINRIAQLSQDILNLQVKLNELHRAYLRSIA